MEIRIIHTKDAVWVEAVDGHGQKSHDIFSDRAAAIDFITNFAPYAEAKFMGEHKAASMAPETTAEKIENYQAAPTECNCPDRVYRGGSYINKNGEKVCKHMLAAPATATTTAKADKADVNPFACFED